jgi:uncharacterized RDD family membrane protein YckC
MLESLDDFHRETAMASVPTSGSTPPPPPPVWDAQPPQTAGRYAGFWVRVIAAFVDGIALSIAWWVVLLFLPTTPMPALPDTADMEALIEYLQNFTAPREVIVYALMVWAYFAFQESSSAQATLGKRMLGIRVSTESAARLSLVAATLRTWPIWLPTVASLLGSGVGTLVGLLALIACIAVAFSAHKRGLHDKMAGAVLTRS